MRVCDVLFAFPGILLAIGVVAIMGSGMVNVIVAVAIFSIPAFRPVRGNTLVLKAPDLYRIGAQHRRLGLDHHPAAHSAGHPVFDRGLFHPAYRHLDHHRRQPVVSGLGAQPPTPEWGAMLNEARADMVIAPHVAIFPARRYSSPCWPSTCWATDCATRWIRN